MSKPFRTVLIATDFSPGGQSASRQLERLLAGVTRARVHVVHVLEPLYLAATPEPIWIDVERTRQPEARRELERVATQLQSRLGPTVGVRTHLLAGTAHDQICKLGAKLRADVIVVGTHGRTGLRHVLLGSVAERVVRHAARPVLTVPVRSGAGR